MIALALVVAFALLLIPTAPSSPLAASAEALARRRGAR
jgi:hypothetical protein